MNLVTSWEEWCEVYNNKGFWEQEISLICQNHGIQIQNVDETYPGTHAVFMINKHMVLKIFCPVQYNSFQDEKSLHEGILSQDALYPRILYEGKSPAGYDYLFFQRSPGLPLRVWGHHKMTAGSLAQLAHAIVSLHRNTLDSSRQGISCLVHYDLTRDHIFLDESGNLSAIIDFGDAIIGHPSDEFPALFVDGLDSNDDLINEFCRYYNSESVFYEYNDNDFLSAMIRHPFCNDILRILEEKESLFSKQIIEKLEKCWKIQ